MRLIGRERLASLSQEGGDTAKWIISWVAEIRDAHWKRPADVVVQFPRALQRSDGTFLFPIRQRPVAVHVLMVFPQGLALVLAVRVLEAANEH